MKYDFFLLKKKDEERKITKFEHLNIEIFLILYLLVCWLVLVFIATFNNISAIS